MSERKEEDAIKIEVPTTKDKNKKEDSNDKLNEASSEHKEEKKSKSKKGKNDKKNPDELSEEDQALKDGLELAVTRLQETDRNLHEQALNHLSVEIKSSTSSMTSVPKPFKFLRPHYDSLKNIFESWDLSHPMKTRMADILSVLGMTMAPQGSLECLKFKLIGTKSDLASWGHEYVRCLAGEISEEYQGRIMNAELDKEPEVSDLMILVDEIIPFQMKHNAEAECVDMLLEVQQLGKLVETPVMDERNFERICLYLLRSADFVSDPDDLETLFETAYTIYKNQNRFCDALRVALRMDDPAKVSQLFSPDSGAPLIVQQQMAFILGRHRSPFQSESEELNNIIGNVNLSDRFLATARSMGASDPKSPEDIFKAHSLPGRRPNNSSSSSAVDSARANLASTLVTGFVNAAHNSDPMVSIDGNEWIDKNKADARMAVAASLGLVMLWNPEMGFNLLDKYLEHSEEFVKAGGCLGLGIVSSGVRNESDAVYAILKDILDSQNTPIVRLSAICGLGIAYAGSQREEIQETLVPIVANTEGANIVEVSFAALTLGMTFVGTCNEEVGGVLAQRLMESSEEDLSHTTARFLGLGLGLLYLGKGQKSQAILEVLKTVSHPRARVAEATLLSCAYAGTGNVLKIQELLRICADRTIEGGAELQAVAALGIALISLGEDISTEMSIRTFEHLQHYCELPVKRAIPLALSLLYISNPDYSVIDSLSRLSHDGDAELSQCAILGLGLVAAGTNNSRVVGLLRQLAEFYSKEAGHLFLIRIAQGLTACGKGLLTLNPFHSDRLLLNGPALSSLLVLLHASLDLKATLLDKYHFLFYFLSVSMNPRVLSTVDESLVPIQGINVRVGLAVETVGQAGRPKTITGFQTHTAPVLIGTRERAELATREYVSPTSILEGTVILQKNPEERGGGGGGGGGGGSAPPLIESGGGGLMGL